MSSVNQLLNDIIAAELEKNDMKNKMNKKERRRLKYFVVKEKVREFNQRV